MHNVLEGFRRGAQGSLPKLSLEEIRILLRGTMFVLRNTTSLRRVNKASEVSKS